MKRYKGVFIASLIASFVSIGLWSGEALAYPFLEVSGYASPDYAGLIDNADNTTTIDVEYTFVVDTADAGAEMNGLSLEFEGDVFTSVNSFAVTAPGDWSVATFTSSSGNAYKLSTAGTTIGQGEALRITSNVTLYDWALQNATNPSDPAMGWGEGGTWEQSFNAFDTFGLSDGGSTTATPEPGTLILLGSGLLGAGYLKRRRKQA